MQQVWVVVKGDIGACTCCNLWGSLTSSECHSVTEVSAQTGLVVAAFAALQPALCSLRHQFDLVKASCLSSRPFIHNPQQSLSDQIALLLSTQILKYADCWPAAASGFTVCAGTLCRACPQPARVASAAAAPATQRVFVGRCAQQQRRWWQRRCEAASRCVTLPLSR